MHRGEHRNATSGASFAIQRNYKEPMEDRARANATSRTSRAAAREGVRGSARDRRDIPPLTMEDSRTRARGRRGRGRFCRPRKMWYPPHLPQAEAKAETFPASGAPAQATRIAKQQRAQAGYAPTSNLTSKLPRRAANNRGPRGDTWTVPRHLSPSKLRPFVTWILLAGWAWCPLLRDCHRRRSAWSRARSCPRAATRR